MAAASLRVWLALLALAAVCAGAACARHGADAAAGAAAAAATTVVVGAQRGDAGAAGAAWLYGPRAALAARSGAALTWRQLGSALAVLAGAPARGAGAAALLQPAALLAHAPRALFVVAAPAAARADFAAGDAALRLAVRDHDATDDGAAAAAPAVCPMAPLAALLRAGEAHRDHADDGDDDDSTTESAGGPLAARIAGVYGRCARAVAFSRKARLAAMPGADLALSLDDGQFEAQDGAAVPLALTSVAHVLRDERFLSAAGLQRDGAHLVTADGLVLDETDAAVRKFLDEVAGMYAVAGYAASLPRTSCPTAVFVTLSSLRKLMAKQPAAVPAALAVAEAVFGASRALLESAYEHSVVSVLAATGRFVHDEATKSAVVRAAAKVLAVDESSLAAAYPFLRVPGDDERARAALLPQLCDAVRGAVADASRVQCGQPQVLLGRTRRAPRTAGVATPRAASSNNGTSIDLVFEFNVFLFLPLVLIIVLVIVLCGFRTAENQRDSIVYRTARPKHTHAE